MTSRPIVSLVQIAASLGILLWVPNNWLKLAAFVIVWALTFGTLSRKEMLFWVAAAGLFTAMDVAALSRGIFVFSSPDFLGMPAYEPLCWGFLMLHTLRLIGGPVPSNPRWSGVALAVVFALPFMIITQPTVLVMTSGALLLAAHLVFRERHDFAYSGYMVLLGCAWEYVGTISGQWSYPGDPTGGVPLWFVPMWGCVGLAARRAILPLIADPRNTTVHTPSAAAGSYRRQPIPAAAHRPDST